MTPKQKQILIRLLLATKSLIRSKRDDTAKRYAAQIADALSDLIDDFEKEEENPSLTQNQEQSP